MKTPVTSINLRIFLALLLFAIMGLLSQTNINITGRAVFSCPAGSSLGMLGPGAGGCCASGCSMPYTGSGYGCSAKYTCMPGLNCRLAQGFTHSGVCEGSPLRCGDGVINVQEEECDGADLGGKTCQSLNRGSGNLKCSSNCKIDVSSCSLSICGDRIVSGKEECDGSHLSCPIKLGATHVTCMPDCTCDYLFGLCGDGRVDGTEECDRNANTCPTKPNTNVKCNSTCQCEYQAIIQTPTTPQPTPQIPVPQPTIPPTTSTPGGPCSGSIGLNCPSGYVCDKGICSPLSAVIVNQPLPTTQQPTTQPLPNVEEQACINGGGVWRKFSNTCADSCSIAGKQPGTFMCGQAIIESCDCGQSNCWNGVDCVSDPVISTPGGQCGGNTGLNCPSGYKCDNGTCTPLSATVVTQPLPTPKPICGNKICEASLGEDSSNCASDCAPPPLCGDGICQGTLDCPQDCTQSITQQPTTPPPTTCPGCLTPDNACLSNGMRWNYEYCDTDNQLKKQKPNGDSCLKSFECEKNFCKDNICQDKPSWLSQAITWVTSLFTP